MIGFKLIFPADNPDIFGEYVGFLYQLDYSVPDKPEWSPNRKIIKAKTPDTLFKTVTDIMQNRYEIQLERNKKEK